MLDEFNKDQLQEDEVAEEATQETVSDATVEAESAQEDALHEELEGIRDMFQRELDAAAESDDSGEIIQELEDVSDEDADENEATDGETARICECCEECAVSKDYGEDYMYCDSCRELMKRYPLRSSGVFMVVVMIVAFVACVYSSMDYMTAMTTVIEGDTYYQEGRLLSAMYSHYSYVNSASTDTVSKRAVKQLIDAFDKTGYSTEVSSLIETHYSETALKMPWNKKYADMLQHNTELEETYYAVTGEVSAALNGEEFDLEEYITRLDALKELNPKEIGESETVEAYNEIFIEYYKYILMSMSGESVEAQLQQLAYIDSINENNMEWAYLANYCAVAAKSGNLELTTELYDRLIEINIEDANAYTALANYYRYKNDPDMMIEVCEKAKENSHSSDLSYKQTLAIAYLLKGEGALALEEMTTYMNSSSYTVQSCNLYALCGLYNGDTDIYDDMKSTLEGAGYEISELVEKYKSEKITIEEALTDMGGDI